MLTCITPLKEALFACRHRALLILQGQQTWAELLLKSQESLFTAGKALVYGDNQLISSTVNNKNYRHFLGQESDLVLYFASSINPDVFAALAGTIKAGGLFCLILADENEPPCLYSQRFIALSKQDQRVFTVQQNQPVAEQLAAVQQALATWQALSIVPKGMSTSSYLYGAVTNDQQQAVQAIIKVAKGHRDRPLVLSADRGRGKSSALALAASELISTSQAPVNIIICAPHIGSLNSFFQRLTAQLPAANMHSHYLEYQGSYVRFMPLDTLLKEQPQAHLLLIDEAASFPIALLIKSLNFYHRLVFSSTLHGYEGAGRGFALKFTQVLQQRFTRVQTFELLEPIRYAAADPLEAFVFNACLLNAQLPELTPLNQTNLLSSLTLDIYQGIQLLDNENLLREIFALLVTAHYQTSPSDLKLLLNNQQIQVLLLRAEQQVVAVALVITEGQLDNTTVNNIRQGKRRLKDHFLPQSLLSHCGLQQAFAFTYWRVMRIAVHPDLQQQGLGSVFLQQIGTLAKQQKVDFLGTSFGLNRQLLNFWQNAGFTLARIGFSKDQASGEHSGLLIKALNHNASAFSEVTEDLFSEQFLYLLAEQYQNLDSALVAVIMTNTKKKSLPAITIFDRQTVDDFVKKYRQYDQCSASLAKCLLHYLVENIEDKKASVGSLLIAKILQRKTTAELCDEFSLTGKKQLQQALLEQIKQLLSTTQDDF